MQVRVLFAIGVIASLALLLGTLVPTNITADAQNVEFVSHIGGETKAVFVRDDYAYIGVGPRLTVLDVSNPALPTVVGKTVPFPSVVRDVFVSGGTAYVAASGLRTG